jgi:hypothetical protein
MKTFVQDLERDARLVATGALGGFEAVCAAAMLLPELAGGPDTVIAHGTWLKADADYAMRVAKRAAELLVADNR